MYLIFDKKILKYGFFIKFVILFLGNKKSNLMKKYEIDWTISAFCVKNIGFIQGEQK